MKKNNINFYHTVGTPMPEGKLTTTGIPNDVMSELVTKLQSGKKTKSIQDNLDNAIKKHNDKLVCETIKLFDREDINIGAPALYGNKTERNAVLTLARQIKDHSKIPLIIDFIPTYNKSLVPTHKGRIFGKIQKPSDLLRHLQDLFEYKKKWTKDLNYQLAKEEVRKKDEEDEKLRKQLEDKYTKEEKERMRKERNEQMLRTIKFN